MTKAAVDGSLSTNSNGSNSSNSEKSRTSVTKEEGSKKPKQSGSKRPATASDRDNTIHPTLKSSSSSSSNNDGPSFKSAKRAKVDKASSSRKPSKAQKGATMVPKMTSDSTPSSTSSEGAQQPAPASTNDGYSQRLKRLELNRKAAKLSRQRRKERIHELEETAAKLRKENQELKIVNATLRNLVESSRTGSTAEQSKLEELQAMNAELKRTLNEYKKAPVGYDMEPGKPMLPRPPMPMSHMSPKEGSTPANMGNAGVYGYRGNYHPMPPHPHHSSLSMNHQHYNNHGMYAAPPVANGSSMMYGSSMGPSGMGYCETISEPTSHGHQLGPVNGVPHRGERQW